MANDKLKIVGDKPLWDEELRAWLEKYIAEHPHHTTEILARSHYIGLPRTILDEYLEGIYFLPKLSGGKGHKSETSRVEQLVRRFRESIEGPLRHGYARTFVQTGAWIKMQSACETAIREKAIVVVYGKPGVGKSRCLLEFARRNMLTAPVFVLCSRNITYSYFAKRLARGIKLSESGITPKLEEDVAEKLLKYPRPLFIDQANYLSEKALGTVCHIWESAHVPVILAGTKSLYNTFMLSQLTEDVRAQLSSRIALYYEIPELSIPEAKTIIQRGLGDIATDDVVALICNATGRIHRHIDMIIPRILDLIARNEEEIDQGKLTIKDIISTANSRLMLW
jgi:DNA transposition AAA+ family ATPase